MPTTDRGKVLALANLISRLELGINSDANRDELRQSAMQIKVCMADPWRGVSEALYKEFAHV